MVAKETRRTKAREEWEGMLAQRVLFENYYPRDVVITCAKCDKRWYRGRYEGRRATVADRADAVRHIREEHGR